MCFQHSREGENLTVCLDHGAAGSGGQGISMEDGGKARRGRRAEDACTPPDSLGPKLTVACQRDNTVSGEFCPACCLFSAFRDIPLSPINKTFLAETLLLEMSMRKFHCLAIGGEISRNSS